MPDKLSDAHQIIAEQRACNEALEADVAELKSQVAELLDRIGKSSRNSSRPPSSDSSAQRTKRRKKPRSARRKGAQSGHPRHERSLLDVQSVDSIERYLPPAHCQCGCPIEMLSEPGCRHQVFDIPTVRYSVTEHQIYTGLCSGCQRWHSAKLPQSIPAARLGRT